LLTGVWRHIHPDIVEGVHQLPFGPGELQELAQVNPLVQAVPLHVEEIGSVEEQGYAHTNPS
jgi:hypothetical protein